MKSFLLSGIKKIGYFFFVMGTVLSVSHKPVLLKSVQYHPGSIKGSSTLELGTMVLFFSEPVVPVVVHKKSISDKSIEQRIMFPRVVLSDEQVRLMVDRINDQKTDGYTIKFIQTLNPVKGLELLITYDQEQILYNYETVASVAALPGYVFRFINNTCYNDLVKKVKEKGITYTAWQKKNHVL